MAKPSSRVTLQDYVFRQLGAPVLEINVADEQFDDLLDDSLQYFYERHFDGVEKVFLKYQLRKNNQLNKKVIPPKQNILVIVLELIKLFL